MENKPWTYPHRRGQFTRENPSGFFDSPESVAEQKARLAVEAARRLKAEQQAEVKRRQSARLTGRSVDTTGDMFDRGKADAPLFALSNPVFMAKKHGAFWQIRTGKKIILRRVTDSQLMRFARSRGYALQLIR